MLRIEFPLYDFKFKDADNRKLIFDPFRKKWVVFTPEEWVRQNFLQYMVQIMQYPASLIAIEKSLRLGELVKRFDILVYDYQHRPWLMVECKAQEIALHQNVLFQLLSYNMSIPVPYLVITNGDSCFSFENQQGSLVELNQMPELKQP